MRARLAILLLSSLLFSCGKSDNAPSGAPIAVAQSGGPIGQNPTTYSLVTGIVGSYPYFYANFQFKENGCDTDLHKFSGPAPEVVMAQLCAALQNEWMNHSCARDMRMAYFSQVCH